MSYVPTRLKDIAQSDDVYLALSQFLDDARASDENSFVSDVSMDPGLTGDRLFDVRIAGVVESLCIERGVEAPAWVDDPSRFLVEPYWAFNSIKPEARAYFERTTPEPFAKRRMYVGEGSISRC